MAKSLNDLSEAGRQELALALLLWRDFKSEGSMDVKVVQTMLELAETLGVTKQVNELMSKLPAMKITPKY